jgi:hypothetical protein
MVIDDDDSSVRVFDDNNQKILDDNDEQNRNLNELINQELPMPDTDNYLYQRFTSADEAGQQRLLDLIVESGNLDKFEKGLNRFLKQKNVPKINMDNVDKDFIEDIDIYLNPNLQQFLPPASVKEEIPVSVPKSPPPPASRSPASETPTLLSPLNPGVVQSDLNYNLQNYDPNAINNLMDTGFASPVFAKANSSVSSSSSSNIGGNSRGSKLRKFKSPLGNQDMEKDNLQEKYYRGMENIVSENDDATDDLNTESQYEPSEFDDGSVALSSKSSTGTRKSADAKIVQEARERDIKRAEEKGIGVSTRGGGNKVVVPVKTNIFQDQKDMQDLAKAGVNAQLNYIRQIAAFGHLKEDEQRRLFEVQEQEKLKEAEQEQEKLKEAANAPVNVLVPRSKKNKGGLGFSG